MDIDAMGMIVDQLIEDNPLPWRMFREGEDQWGLRSGSDGAIIVSGLSYEKFSIVRRFASDRYVQETEGLAAAIANNAIG